mgnify:CR=1 FL=1
MRKDKRRDRDLLKYYLGAVLLALLSIPLWAFNELLEYMRTCNNF